MQFQPLSFSDRLNMSLQAELMLRVERLFEWNNFDRLLRPVTIATSRFRYELERQAPVGGGIPPAAAWVTFQVSCRAWADAEDGNLLPFINNCRHIREPLPGRAPFDFPAKINELLAARNQVQLAAVNGNLEPLRTHTDAAEAVLRDIYKQQRNNHDAELLDLLTAIGRLQLAAPPAGAAAVPDAVQVPSD